MSAHFWFLVLVYDQSYSTDNYVKVLEGGRGTNKKIKEGGKVIKKKVNSL